MATRRIIRGHEIVDDDVVHLDDETPIPPSGAVTVSLARWREERTLRERPDIGVRVDGADCIDEIANDLDALTRVVVEFPKFADGRGYSHARALRDRLGYAGEVRARCDVLLDQLFYMARCGIDAFELAPGLAPEKALAGLEVFTVKYQAAADEPLPIYRRR